MEYEDIDSKKPYWYNSATFISTWVMPGFVKEERYRRMIERVKKHAETALLECGDTAYHNFRVQVKEERDRCYRWLSRMGQENLHQAKMEKFLEFLVNQEFKFLASAFRPWKELVGKQEEHERESAAVGIQRVIRSFILRKREALTERGLKVGRGTAGTWGGKALTIF